MKKPTIYEIKRGHTGHFFDRKTLRFFGQTLKSFQVNKTTDKDIFHTCAAIVESGWRKRQMGFSEHYWQRSNHNEFKLIGTTAPKGIEAI